MLLNKKPKPSFSIIWNLAGQLAILAVGVISVPNLVAGLGIDRFGLLSLAWVLNGFFGLFDLGLSRALLKVASKFLVQGATNAFATITWSTLTVVLLCGLIGAASVASLAPALVDYVFRVPPSMYGEAVATLRILALSIPFVVVCAVFISLMQVKQRFDLVAIINTPFAGANYLTPIAMMSFTQDLRLLALGLVTGRALHTLTYFVVLKSILPELRNRRQNDWRAVRPLLTFGGWITVSSIASPLLTYSDNFAISAYLSVTVAAYYVTVYSMATKLWIVPYAVAGVLFPAIAAANCEAGAVQLAKYGSIAIYCMLLPIVVAVCTLAPELLTFWLGQEFAQRSTTALTLLTIGIFINSLSHIPGTILQALGRPDLPAHVTLCELPFYLVALWWLVTHHGIEGAAMAWVLRATIDTALLSFLASGLVPTFRSTATQVGALLFATVGGIGIASTLVTALPAKLCSIAILITVPLAIVCLSMLNADERRVVLSSCLPARWSLKFDL